MHRPTPRDVSVRTWPIAERRLLPRLLLAGSVALAGTAGWLSHSVAMGTLLGVLLVAGLWRVWIPVTFEIGPLGVTRSVLGRQRRIAWSAVGSVKRLPTGVLLLAEVRPAALDTLRGVWIPFGDQREEILASVEHYLAGRS
jgi:hypothetical protein